MTDYERGVQQASNIYKEVIREYVAENAKLREFVYDMWNDMRCTLETGTWPTDPAWLEKRMSELGIKVEQ